MIVITGSESYIGKNLISNLLRKNQKILGIDLPNQFNNFQH